MCHRLSEFRGGASRMEVLVIVAIATGLFAVLMPMLLTSTEAARQTQSVRHLKQVNLGLQQYHETFNTLPSIGATAGNS